MILRRWVKSRFSSESRESAGDSDVSILWLSIKENDTPPLG